VLRAGRGRLEVQFAFDTVTKDTDRHMAQALTGGTWYGFVVLTALKGHFGDSASPSNIYKYGRVHPLSNDHQQTKPHALHQRDGSLELALGGVLIALNVAATERLPQKVVC